MKDISVLIVEDDDKAREALRVAIKPLFKNIYVASNGYEAIDIYASHNIDVVITDMNMPKINGAELIESIRSDNCIIPFIVTTGYNGFEDIYESMLNIFVLKKPIEIRDIYNLILSVEDDIIKFKKAKDSYDKLKEVSVQAKAILNMLRKDLDDN